MEQGKENRGRSTKRIRYFKWHTIRKDICNERCGEHCIGGSGWKELISPSKRIILVTSAYHMYTAKRFFEK
jgi:hypothetical protein